MVRETIYDYAKQVAELEQTVQRMVFESYGIDKKSFDSHNIESTNYLLRFSKYRGPQMNDETNVGLTSHTDKSFISILHQNQVNGLEVMPRNGDEWIGFEQLPSAFVVMAGDAFLVGFVFFLIRTRCCYKIILIFFNHLQKFKDQTFQGCLIH